MNDVQSHWNPIIHKFALKRDAQHLHNLRKFWDTSLVIEEIHVPKQF